MEAAAAEDPRLLAHYEGLVRKTAARYAGIMRIVGDDFDDVCQVLRLKVWKALLAFEPGRYSEDRLVAARDSYVFGCLRNQIKDMLKQAERSKGTPRDSYSIEGFTTGRGDRIENPGDAGSERDRFDSRYLQVREDEVFGEVEADAVLIPSTLNPNERRVLICMYLEYSQPEAALRLGLQRTEVERAVKNIRKKMADWKPSSETESEPMKQAA